MLCRGLHRRLHGRLHGRLRGGLHSRLRGGLHGVGQRGRARVGVGQRRGGRAVLAVGARQRVVGEVGQRAAAEAEHLLLEVQQVFGVATTQRKQRRSHLLETVGGGGLGGRVVVHAAVDARPGALLLDHVLAAAVRRDLAEEAVEIDLALAEHGLLEGAHVPVLDEELQPVHELGLLARVLRRVAGEVERVVGRAVLGDRAVVVLGVPHVHRALEVRQHRLVQCATAQPPARRLHRHGALLLALAALQVVRRHQVLAAARRAGGRAARVADGHGTHGRGQDLQRRVREGKRVGGRARRDGVAGGLVLGVDGQRTDDRGSAIGLGRREGGGNGGGEGADGVGEEEVEVGGGAAAHVHDEDIPRGAVLLRVNSNKRVDSAEREGAGGAGALDAVDEEERPQRHALLAVGVGADGGVEDVALHVGAPGIATSACGDEALGHVLQLEEELGQRWLGLVEDGIQQGHFHGGRTAVWRHHRDFPLGGEHFVYYSLAQEREWTIHRRSAPQDFVKGNGLHVLVLNVVGQVDHGNAVPCVRLRGGFPHPFSVHTFTLLGFYILCSSGGRRLRRRSTSIFRCRGSSSVLLHFCCKFMRRIGSFFL